MVYSKRFIAVVKVDGRILREFDDQDDQDVLLPFGSEYSLLFKNLEYRTASLKVSIDGKDVLSNNSILIYPDNSVELDGFMDRKGRVTNRFKFIQKTEQIVNHRGDRIDDGIIRIEWRFEKPKPIMRYYNEYSISDPYLPHPYRGGIVYGPSRMLRYYNEYSISDPYLPYDPSRKLSYCSSEHNSNAYCITPEEGITVKGSLSDQQFRAAHIGELEQQSHVIIIRLKGASKGKVITKPIEVKTKVQCETCGTMVRSNNKFCPNCGTCVIEI